MQPAWQGIRKALSGHQGERASWGDHILITPQYR